MFEKLILQTKVIKLDDKYIEFTYLLRKKHCKLDLIVRNLSARIPDKKVDRSLYVSTRYY